MWLYSPVMMCCRMQTSGMMMFASRPPPDADSAVRSTDSDAAQARLSAVRKGYLADPYVNLLVPRSHLVPARPPLINIGTYVRSEALDALVEGWLEAGDGVKQVVSLGAGSDTRFWRIMAGPLKDRVSQYVELDFPEITTHKAQAIRKHKELHSILGPDVKLEKGGTALISPQYSLLPVDLRIAPSESLAPLLDSLSPHIPTLFLAECVLVYMPPSASNALLQWFSDNFDCVGGICYEMFGLEDRFGQVMRENLKARNVSLPGADAYPTLASHTARFQNHAFAHANALTLKTIRQSYISPAELERISRLEMLDEIEELELVLDHYAISWGAKLPPDSEAGDLARVVGDLRGWGLAAKT
ncbi:hypothetical protein BOTBODRAFT_27613 [Botryobasidium botryosum FD-172 SS1]|uniref:Leucine carboxyl methyltransferase 1 n=1 Tax=Botryobasidium botryosum (strain FD-172 SS1) TaxID=930990 RepID=A0A067N7U3_BOTB1|nr:hypothetical protein BOTBODRAFT_27613 [Botryobasidium botryosum FD-172 SS1]